MGGKESKASQARDAIPNLQHALDELMLWRQSDPLHGDPIVVGSTPIGVSGATIGASDAASAGAGAGAGAGGSGTSTPASSAGAATVPMTYSHVGAGPVPAATATGAAAVEVPTPVTPTPSDAAAATAAAAATGEPKSDEAASSTAGGGGGVGGGIGMGSGTGSSIATDQTEDTHAKWRFVHEHVNTVVRVAEEVYMIVSRGEWLKRQLSKTSASIPLGPTTRMALEKKITDNKEALNQHLAMFDSTRAVTNWLQRHYQLFRTRNWLSEEIKDIQTQIGDLQKALPGSSVPQLAAANISPRMRELRTRILRSQELVGMSVRDAHNLRREALIIGLQNFDKRRNGFVDQTDLKEMRVDLFKRLDVQNKYRITPEDLITAVDNIHKRIDSLNGRLSEAEREIRRVDDDKAMIQQELVADHLEQSSETAEEKAKKETARRLRMEELDVDMKKRRDEIVRLNQERNEEEGVLREVYNAFQRGFIESMHARLPPSTPQCKKKYESIGEELERVEQHLRQMRRQTQEHHVTLSPSSSSSSPGRSLGRLGRRGGIGTSGASSSGGSSAAPLVYQHGTVKPPPSFSSSPATAMPHTAAATTPAPTATALRQPGDDAATRAHDQGVIGAEKSKAGGALTPAPSPPPAAAAAAAARPASPPSEPTDQIREATAMERPRDRDAAAAAAAAETEPSSGTASDVDSSSDDRDVRERERHRHAHAAAARPGASHGGPHVAHGHAYAQARDRDDRRR